MTQPKTLPPLPAIEQPDSIPDGAPAHNPTPRELMEQLLDALRLHLWRRLRGEARVPVDLLAVTRVFLESSGVRIHDEASRRALVRIERLYEERLIAALEGPNPSAALLGEARRWFEAKRSTQGPQAEPLADTGLPFTPH